MAISVRRCRSIAPRCTTLLLGIRPVCAHLTSQGPILDALKVLPQAHAKRPRVLSPFLPPCFPLSLWLRVPLVCSLPHLHIGHRAGLGQCRRLPTQLTVASATWWRARASCRCWIAQSERRRVSGTLLSRRGHCTYNVDVSPESAPRLARCPRIGNPDAKQHQRTAQRLHISHRRAAGA